MPRAKVYAAEIDGVHDWIVAAPNQRAALDAFGVHQDLFAQGRARVTTDPAASEAALADPGTPLRRPAGTKVAFQPVSLGGETAWAKAAEAVAKDGPKEQAPSRARLDKAEATLEAFESEAAAERVELERERQAIERRLETLQTKHSKRRNQLQASVAEAKSAYKAKGGRT